MTAEQRPEIPQGFTWKDCTGINARFPMPETWFFKQEASPTTLGYFLTREPIAGESFYVGVGGITLKTTKPEGFFKTGLSVNTIPHFDRITRHRPSRFGKLFIGNPRTALIPTSRATEERNGKLMTFRRFFRSNPLKVMGQRLEPTHYYVEFTANDSTGAAYIIMFETPSRMWKEDQQTARTMIEKRILDPEF